MLVKCFGIDINITKPLHGVILYESTLKSTARFEPNPRFLVNIGSHIEATLLPIFKLRMGN